MKSIKAQLFSREVVPFFAALAALALLALLADAALHLFNVVWLGRYLGIAGTLLVIGSFGYSLRKRGVWARAQLPRSLRRHEQMAWAGSLLILVHSGIHFNAILGWLATWAMLINVASGLTGKYLLARSRKRLEHAQQAMQAKGLSDDAIANALMDDSLTFDVVKQWRAVHFPIALAFAVLALAHIISIFLFWGWK